MRSFLMLLGVLTLVIGGWFALWYTRMAADVARVEASIVHHQQRWQAANRGVTVSAAKISATGFPFAFQVKVADLTLESGWGGEKSRVLVPWVILSKTDARQGRYRVSYPATIAAFYEKDGQPTEHYRVTVNPLPDLAVSAADAATLCGPLVGKPCAEMADNAPIISYAVGLPGTVSLHMELNGDTRDASFQTPPITVPIFQPIPTDISRPLELFVGVLREALVFKTPG